jgi:hypothetical protein|tara:strand:- start:2879 stop:3397 length:519 start_codon:yes stop_codon:yes gene_type:complete
MKKLFAILLLAGVSSPAMANLSIRHQSSLQHTVDSQMATYSRIGNSYSISGTNVTTEHTAAGASSATTGGLGVNTYSGTTGVGTVGTVAGTQGTTNGTGSFAFAQSWTQGDIGGTGSEYLDFGSVSVTNAGTQNTSANAPGTITSAHAITLTGTGNIGTNTTGQFVTEVTAF